MRTSGILVLSLLSSSAFALEYPEPANPAAKTLVAQYIQDKPLIDSPKLFEIPNPVPAWPCNVPEIEQYKIAGLNMAHPELKVEYDKLMRKTFRESGMSAAMVPKSTFSNIQIIPLKAECANGKLAGELQLLVIYDKKDESTMKIPSGEKVINGTTVMNMHTLQRTHMTVQAGERGKAGKLFMQMTMRNETHFDDPAMEEITVKNNEKLGLNKPTIARTVTYSSQDGTSAYFSEMNEQQVSGGLFGVNVKTVQGLTTMITIPVDEQRQRMESYKNKQLLSTSGMKNNKQHGEQVMYMDNYLKKLNMRLDQQPNMENAREVTINGVDMIEMRTCMQNGVAAKISPCPNE